MSILNKTALKDFLIRLFFCLPFVLAVFYSHSYHGELINNSQAQWQYLNDDKGNIYLAIDVYAPSGIKIDGIFSHNRDITDSWRLINYPDWYKGRENFKKLSEFQDILHPYLPYNKDFNVLYTNGWYTFLYEWHPVSPALIPAENSLKLRYQNQGTQNYYSAKHILGVKVGSKIVKLTSDEYPIVEIKILYPASLNGNYENNITLENLAATSDPSRYLLKDLRSDSNGVLPNYSITIHDKKGNIVDSLKGSIQWDKEGAYQQVYTKKHYADVFTEIGRRIDFGVLLRHVVAIIFIVYFVLICWYVGRRFTRWRSIILDNLAARLIVPIFLGILILTYLFFVIGILKLLYFQVLFGILFMILFLGFETIDIFELKAALSNEFKRIKNAPWRVAFLIILAGMIFYNLSYCFVPAVYFDGQGDIENSYLPNLNGYIISHSFKTPIENSTNGINSQGMDVLRTVAKIFIGEPGIYLLSFVYLLLFFGSVYLIGKDFFNIKNLLIYITMLLLVSENLFTEGIHFGKLHIAGLSFLSISLYSIQFFRHNKNYVLPPLFLAFFISQYVPFLQVALVYHLFIFLYFYYKERASFGLFIRSFIVFAVLVLIFPLKLILEVGIFLPPGMIPVWLSDLFLKFNYDNEMYKYIDNNYIRYFDDDYHHLTGDKLRNIWSALSTYFSLLPFQFVLLGLPLLFSYRLSPFIQIQVCPSINVYRALYIIITVVVFLSAIPFYPNPRMSLYYAYFVLIVQFAIIDALFKLRHRMPQFTMRPIVRGLVLMVLFITVFNASASSVTLKRPIFVKDIIRQSMLRADNFQPYIYRFYNEALPVLLGLQSKYHYLELAPRDVTMDIQSRPGAEKYFDHAMLIRQYTDPKDTILIVPVRFHSHTMRLITARHALGSVIYQKDINKIMADLKKLNINYLSSIPINYKDYNPFYTPIFEDDTFYKYFKLLFSYNGSKFYKIIHDGTNTDYTSTPYNVRGLPFVPMLIS